MQTKIATKLTHARLQFKVQHTIYKHKRRHPIIENPMRLGDYDIAHRKERKKKKKKMNHDQAYSRKINIPFRL